MEKILNTEGKEFPYRIETQPFFYPVINYEYACEIAQQWNINNEISGFAGYITVFEVDDEYIKQFTVHQVGSRTHVEYWIPSEELHNFNKNIIGTIRIKEAYFGNEFVGIPPLAVTGFREKNLFKQINNLSEILKYNNMDFSGTVFVEWKLMNLNYYYWMSNSTDYPDTLERIKKALTINEKSFIV
ncbi:hypothetical protein [Erysipelothrix sp. HDW6C]|uniref:hypothetical protein n=1 Tax=Erysipelothrix sp. HDW6C TaxID=2714930 RepID=UPI00196B3B26|nr:hypothetical protein [Erysipelothrix sp. HDW6C]